jgi:predicted transcriptional regulator
LEDGIEKKILEGMTVHLVATRKEIMGFVNGEKKVPMSVVKSVTKSMVQKGFLKEISTSTTSYAITKKGMRSFR